MRPDSNNQELSDITVELAAREPLFHRAEFGSSRQDFERMMAEEFWEVGASGQVYSRAFVLDTLEQRHGGPAKEELVVTNFRCQRLAADLYLASYNLDQSGRITQRASLWRQTPDGWQVVYHQGTVVA
ncbi:DUF4440 domain-containing protein [Gallaecimonas kandeliae]|uniref:nuclear transport factor 2 family protein n=1 Tax=Gallaecimonas kandeliae TaxID=3029055 RepID=UPI002647544D|nr:DUF4440 domain-containing protein [Gallaecimonas kandeliae]WKE64795.1 DUF4440 domain-containing protein [Gallaecimonas kandeliae]